MTTPYDVIVVGLGAMGSLATYELARRGHRVLGLERFASPHTMGSSHGHSRIIREAYFEDPRYVPLVQRAYARWAALEAESGATLFTQTGGLMLGPPDGALVRGARLSAELHSLPHDVISAQSVRDRFPAFHPRDDMIGVWEPRAGILSPETCIAAALDVARGHGAELRMHEAVHGIDEHAAGVTVTTNAGQYTGTSVIVTVGAWTRDLLPELALPLTIQRNVQFWFEPLRNAAQFSAQHFPIFIAEYDADAPAWYGFPDVGDGLKLALHHHGASVHPDAVDRVVAADEVETVRDILVQFMPDANGPLRAAAVCLYTNAPDEHFIIGRHPERNAVILASPCSGHGFKFASVIGAVLADLALDREPEFDLALFDPKRFATT